MNANPHRYWQNLFHKKCPNCHGRLEDSGRFFKCPTIIEGASDPKGGPRNCFFISKEKAASFLLDPKHPAHWTLSLEERQRIEEVVRADFKGMGMMAE